MSFHITNTRNGSLYGHDTKHCDDGGCSGDERFLGPAPEDVATGDIQPVHQLVNCHSCGGRVLAEDQRWLGGEPYCPACDNDMTEGEE